MHGSRSSYRVLTHTHTHTRMQRGARIGPCKCMDRGEVTASYARQSGAMHAGANWAAWVPHGAGSTLACMHGSNWGCSWSELEVKRTRENLQCVIKGVHMLHFGFSIPNIWVGITTKMGLLISNGILLWLGPKDFPWSSGVRKSGGPPLESGL